MKVNRFYILFALWIMLLGWCVTNENVYINAFVLFFGFLFLLCGFAYIDENKNEKEKIEILNQVMESIPKDASVSASTFFTPHLAEREELYEYPYLYDKSIITDYVIIDLRFGSLSDDERSNLESKGYRLSEMQEGLYAIFIQNTN